MDPEIECGHLPDRRAAVVVTRPISLTPAAATAAAPPTVPGYEILGELGRGGMGVVYTTRRIGLKRLTALMMILAGAHAGPQERAQTFAR